MHFGRLLAPVGSLLAPLLDPLASFGSLLVPCGFIFGHFENLLLAFGSFLFALMIFVLSVVFQSLRFFSSTTFFLTFVRTAA
jgi:hypothetical protein